jgi:hypothetical protein
MNWEGEALPSRTYRQIVRSANRQVGKDSDWWMTFLEGSAFALLEKISALNNCTPHSELRTSPLHSAHHLGLLGCSLFQISN